MNKLQKQQRNNELSNQLVMGEIKSMSMNRFLSNEEKNKRYNHLIKKLKDDLW